jgi:hypothetical protein
LATGADGLYGKCFWTRQEGDSVTLPTNKPSAAIPLSFDLGVQGYVGKREGVTGSLQAKFEF